MTSNSQTTWHLKTIRKTSLSATNYLIEHSPADKIVVVSGGFVEATTVKWSDPTLSRLDADHEEADIVFMLSLNQCWCQYVIQMTLSTANRLLIYIH